ncbi:hypothetical protein [Cryptosporangium minutisporangium]|uniref:Uncharacterized protein n=1 Tax=Cryptosporangium minutisporangium TaxID=113569 RepID=A0ABP6T3X3_9ACTN
MRPEPILCISPYADVYPSESYEDFEAEEHILARGVGATPLLWLAMFRLDDVRRISDGLDLGGSQNRNAAATVLTSRQRALTNLYASVPVLDHRFSASLSESAELLREAVRWLSGDTVTIEWWMDDCADTAMFVSEAELTKALKVFESDQSVSTDDVDTLLRLTGLDNEEPRALTRLLSQSVPVHRTPQGDLSRILGRSHMRMVPWEVPF